MGYHHHLVGNVNLLCSHLLNTKSILKAQSYCVVFSMNSLNGGGIQFLDSLECILVFCRKSLVGHAIHQHLQVGDTHHRVSTADMMVEE